MVFISQQLKTWRQSETMRLFNVDRICTEAISSSKKETNNTNNTNNNL